MFANRGVKWRGTTGEMNGTFELKGIDLGVINFPLNMFGPGSLLNWSPLISSTLANLEIRSYVQHSEAPFQDNAIHVTQRTSQWKLVWVRMWLEWIDRGWMLCRLLERFLDDGDTLTQRQAVKHIAFGWPKKERKKRIWGVGLTCFSWPANLLSVTTTLWGLYDFPEMTETSLMLMLVQKQHLRMWKASCIIEQQWTRHFGEAHQLSFLLFFFFPMPQSYFL